MKTVTYGLIFLMFARAAFGLDWNCKSLKDVDVLDKSNRDFHDYKKTPQIPGSTSMTETVSLSDGTIFHFDHNGCKTLADGVQKVSFEVRATLPANANLPKTPTETGAWIDVGLKALRQTGLCEAGQPVTKAWCEKFEQQKSILKMSKDSENVYAARIHLPENEAGEQETLYLFVRWTTPRGISVGNVVITESDSAD